MTLGPITIAIAAITFALSKFQGVVDQVSGILAGLSSAFDVVVERIGRFGLAFQRLRDLDFQGFGEEASNAFAGVGNQIQNTFTEARALSDELVRLRDREIDSIARLAQLEVDISESRRKSAELEKKNAAAAAAELNNAIALVEQRGEIEQQLAADRVSILERQIAQTRELTSAEDRRGLAEARAKLIRIEASN